MHQELLATVVEIEMHQWPSMLNHIRDGVAPLIDLLRIDSAPVIGTMREAGRVRMTSPKKELGGK